MAMSISMSECCLPLVVSIVVVDVELCQAGGVGGRNRVLDDVGQK